jgi:hypothetical protein
LAIRNFIDTIIAIALNIGMIKDNIEIHIAAICSPVETSEIYFYEFIIFVSPKF